MVNFECMKRNYIWLKTFIQNVGGDNWKTQQKKETSASWCRLSRKEGKRREAALRRCFSKRVVFKIAQYLQEKTCVGVSFQ